MSHKMHYVKYGVLEGRALNFLVSLIQVFLTVYIVHRALAGKAD